MSTQTKMQQRTFEKLCAKLEIKTATQNNKEKFNEWMKKMSNIYYSDNEQMCNAYAKIN